MQDHHRAMVDGQPAEAALELVAIDDRAQAIRAPPARQPAGGGGSAPTGGSGDPRRSRHARGAGTTRRRSAPGRGAGAGPARWRAAPAASRPRRGRCRAGSCAPPHGDGRRRRRRGSRRPASSPRCARITRSVSMPLPLGRGVGSTRSHGMGRGPRGDGTIFASAQSRFRGRASVRRERALRTGAGARGAGRRARTGAPPRSAAPVVVPSTSRRAVDHCWRPVDVGERRRVRDAGRRRGRPARARGSGGRRSRRPSCTSARRRRRSRPG